MNIKWVSLFCLFFVMTACTTTEPMEYGKDEPVRNSGISVPEDNDLKHGQSYEEMRKGH